MRLVTFTRTGLDGRFVGLDMGDTVIDVAAGLSVQGIDIPVPFTMRTFLEMGDVGMNAARHMVGIKEVPRFPKRDVMLKAPIFDAPKVICVGMNYVDHCLEQGMDPPKEPTIFNKFTNTICSDGDPLLWEGPEQTKELDFEVELAIVIGKGGRAISKEDAMKHVVGYTVAHDVSARDWQLKRNGGQWLLGKTFDSYTPLGPAIVTTDEIGDPHKLGIRCILNGKEVQNSNTEQMVFKTEACVEWISRYCTLQAGDVILTGTPPGVGCFRSPQLFLKDGDVVTVEVDKIGSITNRVKRIVVPRPHL